MGPPEPSVDRCHRLKPRARASYAATEAARSPPVARRGFRVKVKDLGGAGLRLGFGVKDLGSFRVRVSGLGFRVSGLGFRAQGLMRISG